MIRSLLLIAIVAAGLFAAGKIDGRIAKTNDELKHFDRNYAAINAKMARTAKEILRKRQYVLQQQKKIEILANELAAKSEILENAQSRLQALTGTQSQIEKNQQALLAELSELLAKAYSLATVQSDEHTLSADGIVAEEVCRALEQKTRRRIEQLGTHLSDNRKKLKSLTRQTARLRDEIAQIQMQKKRLETARKKNETAIADLKKRQQGYRKSLKKLLAQKEALEKTLRRLNIIRQNEAERAKAEARRKRNAALLASGSVPQVKSVGSSYKRARTKRYRGKKTIAPLDRYTVTKRYGTYTDPIYHIKIFNESVGLKPRSPNAKVKNVRNGKVILAQKTPLLDNVVIIEHAGGLHTIYAHLDQIAPTVKKGKRLKKGSVIGRVDDELMFEVTQKNYHIDPLQMIRKSK